MLWLLLLLACAAPSEPLPEGPYTAAVLPWTMADGAQLYSGLGHALAGMVTTDLSAVEQLTLVERSRLDALLSEIELGESGFLDPATAQQAGRGLGAQLVVTGSYALVGDQLTVDGRLVVVETRQVVTAADAVGAPEDFVDLEKELVSELLDELSIELAAADLRQLMIQTPTEDFPALAAYGLGLREEQAGDLEDAREAYTEALALDPEFSAAQVALGRARTRLREARARDQEMAATADATGSKRVLAEVQANLSETGPSGRRDRVDLALRLHALDDPCARLAEARAGLIRAGFQMRDPFIDEAVIRRARALGFQVKTDWAGIDMDDPLSPTLNRMRDTERYLVGPGDPVVPNGMLGDAHACLAPIEELEALDDLLSQAPVELGRTFDGLPLREILHLRQAVVRLEVYGPDEVYGRQLTEILDRSPTPGRERDAVLAALDRVAEREQELRRRRFTPAPVAWAFGLRFGDSGVFRDSPTCTAWVALDRDEVNRHVSGSRTQHASDQDEWLLTWLGELRGRYVDMGCLVGLPGRYRNVEDVLTWAATARGRIDPALIETCLWRVEMTEEMVAFHRRNRFRDDAEVARSVLDDLDRLVADGCLLR